MTPTDLRALAARVLGEEPSDELRNAVLDAIGHHVPSGAFFDMWRPNPLTSHDAAFGAMPAGWRVRTGWLDDGSFYAFSRHADHDDTVHANAPTLPRAVTAAGLLARAAEMEAINAE